MSENGETTNLTTDDNTRTLDAYRYEAAQGPHEGQDGRKNGPDH